MELKKKARWPWVRMCGASACARARADMQAGNPTKKACQYGARWPTSAGKTEARASVHHLFFRIGPLAWFLSLPTLTSRFHGALFSFDQRFDKIVVVKHSITGMK